MMASKDKFTDLSITSSLVGSINIIYLSKGLQTVKKNSCSPWHNKRYNIHNLKWKLSLKSATGIYKT